MGSKLHVLAQVIVALAIASTARAQSAEDLLKQAGEAYKAGRYDDAAAALQKAYAIDAKPETLFALAQAERLGGHCDIAIPHYKKLLEMLPDFNVAKLVQSNLTLCKPEPQKPEPPKPEPDAHPDQPTPQPKVIVRTERASSDKLAVTLLAGGTLALGASVGLFVASSSNRDAAADAKTIEINQQINDRADSQRNLGLLTGVVGVGLVSYAIVRWVKGGKEAPGKIAIIPGAGSIHVSARW